MKARIFCTIAWACPFSFDTTVKPSCADCQASWSPTSAIAQLHFWRTRSLIRRSTIRFSFSEWLASIIRVTRQTPTIICLGEGGGDLFDLVGLDHVPDLHVVEVLDADAALVALLHLAHVVLEAAQRAQLA